jgi:hypothetical protein
MSSKISSLIRIIRRRGGKLSRQAMLRRLRKGSLTPTEVRAVLYSILKDDPELMRRYKQWVQEYIWEKSTYTREWRGL